MLLDALTLYVVLATTVAVASLVLWIAALRNPEIVSLRLWAAAYMLAGSGIVLLVFRGRIPDRLSIDLANALILLAFGIGWSSARTFVGRKAYWLPAMAGTVIWLAACQVHSFYDNDSYRVALGSALLGAYGIAAAIELWRNGGARLWRVLTTGVMAFQGFMHFLRATLALLSPPATADVLTSYGLPALAFEAIILTFVGAFLVLMVAKEKVEQRHRVNAMIDPLTGVANRRAFLAEASDATGRAARKGTSVALLLFDLDRFKLINDTHGHDTGDKVLELFGAVATANLRTPDRFGRLGGEEFAAILPGATEPEAHAIAQRILERFAEAAQRVGGRTVEATTSVGVSVATGSDTDLHDMMRRADRALYRAKDLGRNRVEGARSLAKGFRAA